MTAGSDFSMRAGWNAEHCDPIATLFCPDHGVAPRLQVGILYLVSDACLGAGATLSPDNSHGAALTASAGNSAGPASGFPSIR